MSSKNREAGKGSDRRKALVSRKQFEENWDKIKWKKKKEIPMKEAK